MAGLHAQAHPYVSRLWLDAATVRPPAPHPQRGREQAEQAAQPPAHQQPAAAPVLPLGHPQLCDPGRRRLCGQRVLAQGRVGKKHVFFLQKPTGSIVFAGGFFFV